MLDTFFDEKVKNDEVRLYVFSNAVHRFIYRKREIAKEHPSLLCKAKNTLAE